MDNLTHTLLGAALSRAGLNRKYSRATLTLLVAANLPDIDIITGFWGNVAYLKYHRGMTHSMVGVTLLGALLAGGIFLFEKRAAAKHSHSLPSFLWIALICLMGTWSHLLMDFTNSYGIRPFLPFSGRWVAWDLEFIIDPVILTILTGGLVLPSLFRLVSEEVGARRKSRGQGSAIVSLVLIAVLLGVRDVNHRSAVQKLSAFTFRGADPVAVHAFPSPVNPLRWNGVAETPQAYYSLEVGPDFSALKLNQVRVYYKPESSPLLSAVTETKTAKVFLDFARVPIYTVEVRENETQVVIHDLRFAFATRRRRGFAATFLVSKNMEVVSQRFSFSSWKTD